MNEPIEDVKKNDANINEIARLTKTIEKYQSKETRRLVEEVGMNILGREKFVLPEEDDIRKEYVSILFDRLEDENTKIKIDGNKILLFDEKGYTKENEQGTRELTFDELLISKAKRFFKQDLSGNATKATKQQQDANGLPDLKSTEEYYAALDSCSKDPAKSSAIRAHYKNLVAKGVIKA